MASSPKPPTDTELLRTAVKYLRDLQAYTEKQHRANNWYEGWELMSARLFLQEYDKLQEATPRGFS